METDTPFSPRMVVWFASCYFAVVVPPAFAQELRPVIEDRVGGETVYPALPDEDAKARSGWEFGAMVALAYDDNIFLSATAPEADTVISVAPQIAYRRGDPDEGEGLRREGG